MNDLKQRGGYVANGLRLPASLRNGRDTTAMRTQNSEISAWTEEAVKNVRLRSEPGIRQPAMSPLTLIIFSWMHRHKAARPSSAGDSGNR